MADLKEHTKKSGDMIRDRVRILYIFYFYGCAAQNSQFCQQYCSALFHTIAGWIQAKQLVQYC